MKRTLIASALLALVIPMSGQAAEPVTVSAPYEQGPVGGDSWNHFDTSDPATGDVAVVRINPAGISGGLGCGGQGGYNFLKVTKTFEEPVSTVSVAYTNAVIDPYTFIKLSVLKDGQYISSANPPQRGIIAGEGTISTQLDVPTSGQLTVLFGIEVVSACPNVDGGRATFTSVTLS